MAGVGWSDRIGVCLLVVAAGLGGGILGASGAQPFPALYHQAQAVRLGLDGLTESRPAILLPRAYEGEGVVVNDATRAAGGLTLVQGILPGGPQVRLIDAQGNELHRWNVDFFAVWPDAAEVMPAKRIPASSLRYLTQGMWANPDGSLIVNFTGLGSAKIDACSNMVWRSDRPMHHSVTPAADGNFWIPGHIPAAETPASLLPGGMSAADIEAATLTDHYYHDTALLVSPDGEVLRELSVLQAIADAGLENALFESHNYSATDATHVNDIEVVTPELAERIAGVEAGDILVSARAMNMLLILDDVTGELKWHQQGPWVRQHDPDINADGTISVYNNRDGSVSNTVDGSQIVHFDPADRRTFVQHPAASADRFRSAIMGVHQMLPNGNRMIVESQAGRIFEATATGDVVWDYRLPYDQEYASFITFGMRVPTDYFTREFPQCSN